MRNSIVIDLMIQIDYIILYQEFTDIRIHIVRSAKKHIIYAR